MKRRSLRFFLVFILSGGAGALVAMVGTQLLPEPGPPSAVERDALAGRRVDIVELARANASRRLPGQLLVWLILPAAFVVVGGVAGVLGGKAGPAIAALAAMVLLGLLMSGSKPVYNDLLFGAAYTGIACVSAWLSRALQPQAKATG